jgi:hypothetical protein
MQLGEHELILEAPDLVVIRVRGSVTPYEVEKISQLIKEAGQNGTAYILTIIETATFKDLQKLDDTLQKQFEGCRRSPMLSLAPIFACG